MVCSRMSVRACTVQAPPWLSDSAELVTLEQQVSDMLDGRRVTCQWTSDGSNKLVFVVDRPIKKGSLECAVYSILGGA